MNVDGAPDTSHTNQLVTFAQVLAITRCAGLPLPAVLRYAAHLTIGALLLWSRTSQINKTHGRAEEYRTARSLDKNMTIESRDRLAYNV